MGITKYGYSVSEKAVETELPCEKCTSAFFLVSAFYVSEDPDEGDSGGDAHQLFLRCPSCGYKKVIISRDDVDLVKKYFEALETAKDLDVTEWKEHGRP